MIELRYPNADGSQGAIEATAVQLDGDSIQVVRDEGSGISHTMFAVFNGVWFRPANTVLAKDADETISELEILPGGDSEMVEVAVEGEKPSAITRPSGSFSIGSGKKLTLSTSTQGIELANELGTIASWRDIPGSWLDASGKELGPRLLLAPPDYIDVERLFIEVPITPSPRSRRSPLAERLSV